MNFTLNILLYFFIALMLVQNHLIVAFLAVGIFTFRVGAVWLLPLAFLIDGYFGAFYHVPVISLCAIVWFFATEFIRPRLLIS